MPPPDHGISFRQATFTGSSPFTANLLLVSQALFAGRGCALSVHSALALHLSPQHCSGRCAGQISATHQPTRPSTERPVLSVNLRFALRRSVRQGAKVLGVTYLGCFLGALLVGAVCVAGAAPAVGGATALALKKALLAPSVVFFRAIFAGWLIALAVVLATAAQDAGGKMAVIWVCISTYAMCECEHALSVMVLFNMAMLGGADITIGQYLLVRFPVRGGAKHESGGKRRGDGPG